MDKSDKILYYIMMTTIIIFSIICAIFTKVYYILIFSCLCLIPTIRLFILDFICGYKHLKYIDDTLLIMRKNKVLLNIEKEKILNLKVYFDIGKQSISFIKFKYLNKTRFFLIQTYDDEKAIRKMICDLEYKKKSDTIIKIITVICGF